LKIRIIGAGNTLLRDDGVGMRVARDLLARTLPPQVEVVEGGVGGLALLDYFQGSSKVILADAAAMDREPGAVVRFTPAEIRAGGEGPRFSVHDIGLLDLLEIAGGLGRIPPEIVIFGIQPREIDWGEGLSPEVEAAVPKAVAAILKELGMEKP
jgi:hydrogenase maturation protease